MKEGGPLTYVVKNRAHKHPETFDREKLHKSIVAASLSAGAPTGHAESIARRVTDEVIEWLKERPEVTSNDLRRTAAKYLRTHHPDASYLYEHHQATL
jgi:transcriptional regulator NrdR family protein